MAGKARKAALVVGALLLTAAVGLGAWFGLGYMTAAAPSPSEAGTETAALGQKFPDVDWDKQLKKSPDMIGWVSVPGTKVSYPIVQASESDPGFYLNHNSRKDWSAWGCPYLAADRAEAGLLSSVPVIYGHHMNDNTMFSRLAEYTDKGFAKKHKKILVQTPEWRMVLSVKGARVANASSEYEPVNLTDMAELEAWAASELEKCPVTLGGKKIESNQVFVFVTCSYGTYANQRTLVYAVPTAYERVTP